MKIAFIIDSLFNSRGMERVLSTCSNMLCNSYDISIITAFNDNKPDFFRLESSIIRKDLGINHRRCFLTLFNNILVKRDYKKALQEYLIKKPQDIVISLGGMDMYFINSLKDRSKKVLWFHFAFNTASVFINEKYNSVMAYFLCKWHSYRMVCCAKNFSKVVLISKADFNTWKHYCNNVTYIYNPITITPKETSPLKEKRAIAVGVLGIQKGFDYLIDSWKIVAQRHPDWKLDIFGAGPDKDKLQNQITRLQLSNTVILRGRSSFIEDEYINHSFFILSSRTE